MFLRTMAAAVLALTPCLSTGSVAAQDWTGAYAGADLGALRTTGEAARGDYAGGLLTLDVGNGLFPGTNRDVEISATLGATLGYDRQSGPFVLGAALDAVRLNADARSEFARIDPNPAPPFTGVNTITRYETGLDTLVMARLRAGRSFGPMLVYATGGLALGRVENRFALTIPELGYASPDWSASDTRAGYVLGAGVERRLTPRLSAKAEILHYDLRDVTIDAADPVNFPGQEIAYRFENAGTIARIGLNYRF